MLKDFIIHARLFDKSDFKLKVTANNANEAREIFYKYHPEKRIIRVEPPR